MEITEFISTTVLGITGALSTGVCRRKESIWPDTPEAQAHGGEVPTAGDLQDADPVNWRAFRMISAHHLTVTKAISSDTCKFYPSHGLNATRTRASRVLLVLR